MELLEVLQHDEGFSPVKTMRFSEARLADAHDLLTNAKGYASHKWEYLLKEAITTTDFPYLFGQILDREILARYAVRVPTWTGYCRKGTSADFRQKEIHKVQGVNDRLPLVTEKGEYLVSTMIDAHYHLQVYKRGRQFDISWEAIVNDVLNAFGDIPQRYAEAAVRTEAQLVTELFASATGPNALLFGAALPDVDLQVIVNVGVLPLTIANLEITLGLMALQQDVQGHPLSIRGVHLVVPPQLEFTARQILTSTHKQWLDTAAGTIIPMPTANVVSQIGLQLHIDPYLPVVDTSGTGDRTWYLFADPAEGMAMEFDYLRGHESPEICMKASNKVSTTGAPISPFAGDFATDNIFYRVRIVCGGAQLDPRFAYAQVAPADQG